MSDGEQIGYVVESPIKGHGGARDGTARVYVASEARAKEIADAHKDRTFRPIPYSEMPQKARENLERAARERV